MSPTIMVLTDSPHVPTTDSLTGNFCKNTKKFPKWWEDWFATVAQGTDPSVSLAATSIGGVSKQPTSIFRRPADTL